MQYIIKEGHAIGVLSDTVIHGPFNTPEIARIYAQENNLNNYIVDILIKPYS